MEIEFADSLITQTDLQNVKLNLDEVPFSTVKSYLISMNKAYEALLNSANFLSVAYVLNDKLEKNIDEATLKKGDKLYIFIPLSGG